MNNFRRNEWDDINISGAGHNDIAEFQHLYNISSKQASLSQSLGSVLDKNNNNNKNILQAPKPNL